MLKPAGAMQILSLPARRLSAADESWAAVLLAEAYAAGPDPVPTAVPAAARQRDWLHLLLRYALHRGCVYAGLHDHSVAVWLPADATELTWGSLLRAGQLALPLQLGWGAFWELMDWQQRHDARRHRVLPTAHHHLLALGVRPNCQRQGAGRALLRASLAAVGGRFLPCYTDVYSLSALLFAQQLGFEVASYEELPTPAGPLPCWGVVRAASAV